jgi:signal transduction histidine kinase
MSCFRPGGSAAGPGAHIGYSPYCVPRLIGGVKFVIVDEALRDIDVPDRRQLVRDVCPVALVVADRHRMLQVLTNLVVNALRHGEGTVEVRVRSEGETTTIDVLDEGSGVQPEHVHELFLPFARFSTRTDSTGLGLAICRTIVEAHGGTIRYSRVQGGRRTRFRVRLPADAA